MLAWPSTSRRFYEDELRGFGPRQKAKWNEGGAEPGRDVKRAAVQPVEAVEVAPTRVRERDPPARERQCDLARVKMAGDDEIEHVLREPVDHVREVTEQDSQVRLG